jgi:hypothetical protein
MNTVWIEKYPLYKTVGKSINDNILSASEIIRDSMKKNETIQSTAFRLKRSVEMKKDVAKQIDSLVIDSRRFASGAMSEKEYIKFKRDIVNARNYAQKLAARTGADTDLRSAYLELIRKIETGSARAVESALKSTVITKMKYNAQRLANTEMARAYGQAKTNDFLTDDLVIGYRRKLSSSHSVRDICDPISGIFFPKNSGPPYPIHPFDMCKLEPVYRSDAKITDSSAYSDIKQKVDGYAKEERIKIMGHNGEKQYKKDGSITNIRGWEPFEEKKLIKIL